MMDQDQQFMKRARKLLKRAETEVEGAYNLLDDILTDDTLAQQYIDDGGTMFTKKNNDIRSTVAARIARLESETPEFYRKKHEAEERLNARRALDNEETEITIRMGREVHTLKGATRAQAVGDSWRDSEEYRAAVIARRDLGDHLAHIGQNKNMLAKIDKEIADLKALMACVNSEAA